MNPSTGIAALDNVINGLRPGDNVVWKVDSVHDYEALAAPFWQEALRARRQVVYIRFAKDAPLIPDDVEAVRITLDSDFGIEKFITEVHGIIKKSGPHTNFVFDMFTDLARELLSERMIGNFFTLTCPYINAVGSVAYFGVLRHFHAYYAMQPINDTAELLLDVYRYQGELYLHPVKAFQRRSSTLNLLHRWTGDTLTPITDSAATAAVTHSSRWPGLQSASYRMIGMWDRRFMHAEEILADHERGAASDEAVSDAFDRLVPQLLSKDPKVISLIKQYMTLPDILDIWKHVIGSGMIGGKSVGMLLSRAILKRADPKWNTLLEDHDSFYVAADIFYQFLVQNDCWWIRRRQADRTSKSDGFEEVRTRVLKGTFPPYLLSRFSDMLDYFGQSPIIVRSSSLMEDAFGNAFAGTYESIFCANQGSRHERLEEFLRAVRRVYASSLSEKAFTYRAKRNVLEHDEQMALLVQRVSGNQYDSVFYPHLAGVGLSFNPYVWSSEIDPEAGVVRLVVGLGTRAVDRADDDYTRIIALNAPFKRPEGDRSDIRKHSQKRVDHLDLTRNTQAERYFDEITRLCPKLPKNLLSSAETVVDRDGRIAPGIDYIDLDRTLKQFPLADDLRALLATLRTAYDRSVEVEFTINIADDTRYRMNLLQCRPLQIKEHDGHIEIPKSPRPEDILMKAEGAVLGTYRTMNVSRIIYVVPSVYATLPTRDRFTVAKVIGKISRLPRQDDDGAQVLVVPGRFGTTMPELGVPVAFSEIGSIQVICELDTMHEGLNPDLSLGTHFFHELAECNMLYIGHVAARKGNIFNYTYFEGADNQLPRLLPDETMWSDALRVLDFEGDPKLHLYANHVEQQALLYFDSPCAVPR